MHFWLIILPGNHTIALIKGKEEHETLKRSLGNVIKDVNSLIEDKEITVDGSTVRLEFYLGGDYKVNKFQFVLTTVQLHYTTTQLIRPAPLLRPMPPQKLFSL